MFRQNYFDGLPWSHFLHRLRVFRAGKLISTDECGFIMQENIHTPIGRHINKSIFCINCSLPKPVEMARLSVRPSFWVHIIAWTAFISYEVPIANLWETKAGADEFICYYILDILLFYINAGIITQNAGRRETILLKLIPFMLLELILFFSLSLAVGIVLYKIHHHWIFYAVTTKDCARAIWRGIYIMGLSTGYGFFRRAIKAVKEKNSAIISQMETEHSRIEMEKNYVKVQNAYLQSQISRHLLYNTLTFIYGSVFRISAKAGRSVMLLKETMNYSLTEQPDGKARLIEEIGQIERYIELNELRFNQPLWLDFKAEVPEDCEDTGIPPLILLDFVENIFKHGDLTTYEENAVIFIHCDQSKLSLHTRNFKKNTFLPETRSHIGITNARTRLASFYGQDNFELTLTDTKEEFIVDLIIRLC